MAIHPDDLVNEDLSATYQAMVTEMESTIDGYLKQRFRGDKLNVPVGVNVPTPVVWALKEMYEKAGWVVEIVENTHTNRINKVESLNTSFDMHPNVPVDMKHDIVIRSR